MIDPDLPDEIHKLISDVGAVWRKDSICTSWILLTEWVDADGNKWIEESRTESLTEWQRQGILGYVLEQRMEIDPEWHYLNKTPN